MRYDEQSHFLIELAFMDELEKIAGSTSESLGRLVRGGVDSLVGKPVPPLKDLKSLPLLQRLKMGRKGRKAYAEQFAADAQRKKDIENVLSTAGKAGAIGGAGLIGASALGG